MGSKSGFSLDRACWGSSETSARVRGAGPNVWVDMELISELCGVRAVHRARWPGQEETASPWMHREARGHPGHAAKGSLCSMGRLSRGLASEDHEIGLGCLSHSQRFQARIQ